VHVRNVVPFVLFWSLACGGVAVSEDTATAPAPASGAAPIKTTVKAAPVKTTPKTTAPPAAGKADTTGQIEVATAAAVTVQIDGSNVMFDPIQGAYIKRNLSPGEHTVEVFNALGKEVAEEKVDVKAAERTKFRYKNGGRMENFGSFPID
jgi:hypothetical protein